MKGNKALTKSGFHHPARRSGKTPVGIVLRSPVMTKENSCQPRVVSTDVRFRISQKMVDWLYSMYPNASNTSTAALWYLQDKFKDDLLP